MWITQLLETHAGEYPQTEFLLMRILNATKMNGDPASEWRNTDFNGNGAVLPM